MIPQNTTVISSDAYRRGLAACSQQTNTAPALPIAAVNLSLACECVLSATEQARLDDQVVRAHSAGISVLAAAGNTRGAVQSPGSSPGVIPVAAGDTSGIGNLCSYAAYAPGVLVGPACGVDVATYLGEPARTDGVALRARPCSLRRWSRC